MNSKKIKEALALVHHNEKMEGTLQAAKAAAQVVGLSVAEKAVLFRTLRLES